MDNQSIFDQVARHLLTQKKRSLRRPRPAANLICAYRGDNGLKCAVGCLISDEDYDPSMEGLSVREGAVRDWRFKRGYTMFGELLLRLQEVHDFHEPEHWPRLLASVATYFGLNTMAIDDMKEDK